MQPRARVIRMNREKEDSAPNTTTSAPSLVPTLRVGMPASTLHSTSSGWRHSNPEDAEHPKRHSHAERGNELNRLLYRVSGRNSVVFGGVRSEERRVGKECRS